MRATTQTRTNVERRALGVRDGRVFERLAQTHGDVGVDDEVVERAEHDEAAHREMTKSTMTHGCGEHPRVHEERHHARQEEDERHG